MTTDFKSYQNGVCLGDGTYTVGAADCDGVWKLLGMDEYDFRGKSVLDAGCNIGYFALKAAEQGAEVTAFDATRASIAILDDLAYKRNVKVRTFVCDFWSPRWRECAPFDVVIANRFLYYIKRPDEALREICGSAANALFAYTLIRGSKQKINDGSPGHTKVHTLGEWTEALLEHGYHRITVSSSRPPSQYLALNASKDKLP